MALETGNRIADLVPTNPVGATDFVSQGDDHLRLVKACIQGSFPSLGATAVERTGAELNGIKDASNLDAGTLADARLSSNVPLKNATNVFTAVQRVDADVWFDKRAVNVAGAYEVYRVGSSIKGYIGTDGGAIVGGGTGDNFGLRSEGGLLLMAGGSLRATASSAGNWTINPPSSGTALTVYAVSSANVANFNGPSGGDAQINIVGDDATWAVINEVNSGALRLYNGAYRFTLGNGLQLGAPTGGDKGAGTLNTAGDIYINNVSVRDASGINAGTLNNARLPATINVTALQQGSVGVQSLPLVTSTSTTLAKGQMHHISGTATIPSLSNGEWVSVVNTSGSSITINKVAASTSYWSAAGTSISSSISLGPRGRLFVSSNGSAYFFSGDIVGSS